LFSPTREFNSMPFVFLIVDLLHVFMSASIGFLNESHSALLLLATIADLLHLLTLWGFGFRV
jgi:hypothetical protein